MNTETPDTPLEALVAREYAKATDKAGAAEARRREEHALRIAKAAEFRRLVSFHTTHVSGRYVAVVLDETEGTFTAYPANVSFKFDATAGMCVGHVAKGATRRGTAIEGARIYRSYLRQARALKREARRREVAA